MDILDVPEADYPEIVEVWEASVRATHDFLAEADIEFFKQLILTDFLPAVQLRCVRDAAASIRGFLGVAEGNVEMLFISPGARGNGIGKSLLNYAIDCMAACKVDVNEQNPQAVGFYHHMGFEIIDRSALDGMGKPYPLLHMQLKAKNGAPTLLGGAL